MTHHGHCHCGAVDFIFRAPSTVTVLECNCSICEMGGFVHLIIPKSRFSLVKGQNSLTEYRFGTHVARHLFCGVCGIKPFYIPRSNPDGVSINMRCVNQASFENVKVDSFDGKNWEEHAHRLKHCHSHQIDDY